MKFPFKKTVTAAALTIHNAGDMTPRGRAVLARWLKSQAEFLTKHGHEFAPKFKARYEYEA
jgi:hypothetical protein